MSARIEYDLFSSIPKRSSKTRPLIIIQARLGSTRLPGKILMQVEGKPLLQILIERLSFVEKPVDILVATTLLDKDDATLACVEKTGILCFRGKEDDVLDRFIQASQGKKADAIVRITADCPLMDPELISRALDLFYSLDVDYLSNTLRRTFARGYDIEIIRPAVLEQAAREATSAYDREHVTPYILTHEKEFSCANFISLVDLSPWRITVDTAEDFSFVHKIVSILGSSIKTCSFTQVRDLFLQHPEWAREKYVVS